VKGSGLSVQGCLGFEDFGFKVWRVKFRVKGLGFRAQSLDFRAQGLELRVSKAQG
jgi:hypothetical protein